MASTQGQNDATTQPMLVLPPQQTQHLGPAGTGPIQLVSSAPSTHNDAAAQAHGDQQVLQDMAPAVQPSTAVTPPPAVPSEDYTGLGSMAAALLQQQQGVRLPLHQPQVTMQPGTTGSAGQQPESFNLKRLLAAAAQQAHGGASGTGTLPLSTAPGTVITTGAHEGFGHAPGGSWRSSGQPGQAAHGVEAGEADTMHMDASAPAGLQPRKRQRKPGGAPRAAAAALTPVAASGEDADTGVGEERSSLRGVFWDRKTRRWRSQLGYQNKKIFMGYFDSSEDAARAYDMKLVELHGVAAAPKVNFPISNYVSSEDIAEYEAQRAQRPPAKRAHHRSEEDAAAGQEGGEAAQRAKRRAAVSRATEELGSTSDEDMVQQQEAADDTGLRDQRQHASPQLLQQEGYRQQEAGAMLMQQGSLPAAGGDAAAANQATAADVLHGAADNGHVSNQQAGNAQQEQQEEEPWLGQQEGQQTEPLLQQQPSEALELHAAQALSGLRALATPVHHQPPSHTLQQAQQQGPSRRRTTPRPDTEGIGTAHSAGSGGGGGTGGRSRATQPRDAHGRFASFKGGAPGAAGKQVARKAAGGGGRGRWGQPRQQRQAPQARQRWSDFDGGDDESDEGSAASHDDYDVVGLQRGHEEQWGGGGYRHPGRASDWLGGSPEQQQRGQRTAYGARSDEQSPASRGASRARHGNAGAGAGGDGSRRYAASPGKHRGLDDRRVPSLVEQPQHWQQRQLQQQQQQQQRGMWPHAQRMDASMVPGQGLAAAPQELMHQQQQQREQYGGAMGSSIPTSHTAASAMLGTLLPILSPQQQEELLRTHGSSLFAAAVAGAGQQAQHPGPAAAAPPSHLAQHGFGRAHASAAGGRAGPSLHAATPPSAAAGSDLVASLVQQLQQALHPPPRPQQQQQQQQPQDIMGLVSALASARTGAAMAHPYQQAHPSSPAPAMQQLQSLLGQQGAAGAGRGSPPVLPTAQPVPPHNVVADNQQLLATLLTELLAAGGGQHRGTAAAALQSAAPAATLAETALAPSLPAVQQQLEDATAVEPVAAAASTAPPVVPGLQGHIQAAGTSAPAATVQILPAVVAEEGADMTGLLQQAIQAATAAAGPAGAQQQQQQVCLLPVVIPVADAPYASERTAEMMQRLQQAAADATNPEHALADAEPSKSVIIAQQQQQQEAVEEAEQGKPQQHSALAELQAPPPPPFSTALTFMLPEQGDGATGTPSGNSNLNQLAAMLAQMSQAPQTSAIDSTTPSGAGVQGGTGQAGSAAADIMAAAMAAMSHADAAAGSQSAQGIEQEVVQRLMQVLASLQAQQQRPTLPS